jgi:uncharacterized protein (TIGR02284 family)
MPITSSAGTTLEHPWKFLTGDKGEEGGFLSRMKIPAARQKKSGLVAPQPAKRGVFGSGRRQSSVDERRPQYKFTQENATPMPTSLKSPGYGLCLNLNRFQTPNFEVVMRTQATIRILNKLIRTCRDSEELCNVCADAVASPGLRSLMRYRSEEWGRQGDELQALVLLLGGNPVISGSFSAHISGGWLGFKTALLGPSDLAAIEAWQQMQQRGQSRYNEALGNYLPERIRRTVSLQANRILDRSEKIGMLREEYTLHSQGA